MSHTYLVDRLQAELGLRDPNNHHYQFIEDVDGPERIKLLLILEILKKFQLLTDGVKPVPQNKYTIQPGPCCNQKHISLRRDDTPKCPDFARIALIERNNRRFFYVSFYKSIMKQGLSKFEIFESSPNNTDIRFAPVDINHFIVSPESYLKSPAEIANIIQKLTQ